MGLHRLAEKDMTRRVPVSERHRLFAYRTRGTQRNTMFVDIYCTMCLVVRGQRAYRTSAVCGDNRDASYKVDLNPIDACCRR